MTNTEQPGLDAVESGEYLLIPKATVDFLTGAKPDESGQWFGDQPKGPRRQFWWREKLNNLQPAPDTVGVPGAVLRSLVNEVKALRIEEHEIRHLVGNTNWACLMQRLEEAEAALLATPLQLDEDRSFAAEIEAQALEQFTEYFVRNYPGPNTIIFDPKWHAPRIFRSALSALSKREARQPESDAPKSMGDIWEKWDAQHGSGAIMREYDSLKRPQSSEKET